MEEKNVAVLATLLKKPIEDVTKAIEEEGGLETLVSDFNTNNQVFDLTEFATLKQNLKKETIEHLEEKDIPETFKNKAVGWKLGALEEEIKKTYQFTDDHKGLTDLVEKIVTKAKVPNANGDEVTALKNRIIEIEDDFKDKLKVKQDEFDTSLIETDFNNAIKKVGLDYEGDVLKKQKELLKSAFNGQFNLKRDADKTVSLKGEDVVKDNKFDPLPLTDVLLSVAKEFGFQIKSPDNGGHGGHSSKKKAGLTGVSWSEYLEKNGVKSNTPESDKLYIEWKAANK